MAVQVSNSQQRLLSVLFCLKGYEIIGMSTGEVAKNLNISIVNASRDLGNLQVFGVVAKTDDGRWKVARKMIEFSTAMHDGLNKMQQKIDECRTY